MRATQPVLIRRQADAFEEPVTIFESIPGLAIGYDATGYSIGHLNTAYAPTCSETSLRSELHGIAERLDEAMEVVDNASVIALYQASLEKRIRAGIVAKAMLADPHHDAPDPEAVELAYQRHFARAVPAIVQRAASVLGKHPVPVDDLSAVSDDDDDEFDAEDGEVTEADAAQGKSEDAPKYIFGRLNKAWKPKKQAGADRFAKRTAAIDKLHTLWKAGKKKGDPEWDAAKSELLGSETMRERRARYLERMDSVEKRMADGKTVNSRGESLADVKERLRLRVKQVQKTMKAKGVVYQSASPKAKAKVAPAAKPKPAAAKAKASVARTQPGKQPRKAPLPKGGTPPRVPGETKPRKKRPGLVLESNSLEGFLRMAEARLEEHGKHDQRTHSPTGRAAIAAEKAGGGAKAAAPSGGGGGGGGVELSARDKDQQRRLGNQIAGRNADDDGDGKYKPPARAQTTIAKAPKPAKTPTQSLLSRLKAKFAKAGGTPALKRELKLWLDSAAYVGARDQARKRTRGQSGRREREYAEIDKRYGRSG